MSMCKIDTIKNEREYASMSISEPDVVKWLIFYRDKYDSNFKGGDVELPNDLVSAGEIEDLNRELIVLYADLDKLIEQCDFDKSQLALIKLLYIGYEFQEIADLRGVTYKAIQKRFDTIVNKIVKVNRRNWSLYVHRKVLDTKEKLCRECRVMYPLTNDFFSRDKKNADGFKNKCKNCM